MENEFIQFLSGNIEEFLTYTGFANFEIGNLIMIICGIIFIYLAIAKEFEPMLLIPIGFGILIGNIPFKDAGLQLGIYEQGSVLNILYQGVTQGWYPPLIFLGIGAMTDFSALISNPKLMLIGAAAQFGIFGAYAIALAMGFEPNQAGAIGIIGGADGPTAIFLSSKLAPNLMGAIAISAYSYMALVPVIQPPIMRLLTTKKETTSCSIPYRKSYLSDCRIVINLFPCSIRSSSFRYVILRKSIKRKRSNSSFSRNSPWSINRCRYHFVRTYSRCIHTSLSIPNSQLGKNLHFRGNFLYYCYCRRSSVR